MEELVGLVGSDDSGILIRNGPGEVEKVSRYWVSSLDHAVHFQALCAQLPSVLEMRRLKKKHDMAIEFSRFWIGLPGRQAPKVDNGIRSVIHDYGGTFEDEVDFADIHSGDGTGFVKFCVSAASLMSEELREFLGEPTKEDRPQDRFYKAADPMDEDEYSNVLMLKARKTRHLWTVDSSDLTDSSEWHDALWAVLDYLKPAACNWRSYVTENELEVEFFSIWTADDGAAGPVLTTKEFERIQSYGAEWNLETYYPDGS